MAAKNRRTLTVTVMSVEAMKARTMQACGGKQLEPVLAFATRELLRKILTPKREDILTAMSGAGPMSIRALARAMGRDVKAVHGDVHALLKSRILSRNEDGLIEFPYDVVRVDYDLMKAA